MNYYWFVQKSDGFYALVYTYDESGNREIPVWKSPKPYPTKEEAIEAAATWANDTFPPEQVEMGS